MNDSLLILIRNIATGIRGVQASLIATSVDHWVCQITVTPIEMNGP